MLARRRNSSVPLTLEQLPFLAGGLPTEAVLGDALCPLGLRAFERVKTTANRLPVYAVLVSELRLRLGARVEVDYEEQIWPAERLLRKMLRCSDVIPGSDYREAVSRFGLEGTKQSYGSVAFALPDSRSFEPVTCARCGREAEGVRRAVRWLGPNVSRDNCR